MKKLSGQALLGKLEQLLRQVVKFFQRKGLPAHLIPILIMAMTESVILKIRGVKRPKDRKGLTAWESALKLRGLVAIGVMGGTKFAAKRTDGSWHSWGEFYYRLNQELATLLAKFPNIDEKRGMGVAILGGGSWGLAMHGLFHTYKLALSKLKNCAGFTMAVMSSLKDESINPAVDRKTTIEMQPSILARELLLILLSEHMIIVYPGSDGTFSERVMAKLINYCTGRGLVDPITGEMLAIEAPWRPIVIVDWPTSNNGWFFQKIDEAIQSRVAEFGLGKVPSKTPAGIDETIQPRVAEFGLGEVSSTVRPPYYYVSESDPVVAARKIVEILANFLSSSNLIERRRLYGEEFAQ